MLYLASINVNLSIKWLKNSKFNNLCIFLLMDGQNTISWCMVVYIDGCSLRVSQRNILWLNAVCGVNWRQFEFKWLNKRTFVNFCMFWLVDGQNTTSLCFSIVVYIDFDVIDCISKNFRLQCSIWCILTSFLVFNDQKVYFFKFDIFWHMDDGATQFLIVLWWFALIFVVLACLGKIILDSICY